MRFYTVNNDYITYLREHDNKVPDNYMEKKPYVGIVLEINKHKYLAPLTSYKTKQDKFNSSNPTIFKVHEKGNPSNKLGMLQLNNMIPVLETVVSMVNFAEQEHHYKVLLDKQYAYIKSEQDIIKGRAKHLYQLVTVHKHIHFCNLSCDFIKLETVHRNFNLL